MCSYDLMLQSSFTDYFYAHHKLTTMSNQHFFLFLKVRQFQNQFMKSSFLPKYKQKKNVRIFALCSEGRNFDNFLFVFREKP